MDKPKEEQFTLFQIKKTPDREVRFVEATEGFCTKDEKDTAVKTIHSETEQERFELSVPPLNYIELVNEWELYREAHNGFDCYLACELLRTRRKLEKIKKINTRGAIDMFWPFKKKEPKEPFIPNKPLTWWIDDLSHRVCALVDHPELGLDKLPWPDNEKVSLAVDKRAYDLLEKQLFSALDILEEVDEKLNKENSCNCDLDYKCLMCSFQYEYKEYQKKYEGLIDV